MTPSSDDLERTPAPPSTLPYFQPSYKPPTPRAPIEQDPAFMQIVNQGREERGERPLEESAIGSQIFFDPTSSGFTIANTGHPVYYNPTGKSYSLQPTSIPARFGMNLSGQFVADDTFQALRAMTQDEAEQLVTQSGGFIPQYFAEQEKAYAPIAEIDFSIAELMRGIGGRQPAPAELEQLRSLTDRRGVVEQAFLGQNPIFASLRQVQTEAHGAGLIEKKDVLPEGDHDPSYHQVYIDRGRGPERRIVGTPFRGAPDMDVGPTKLFQVMDAYTPSTMGSIIGQSYKDQGLLFRLYTGMAALRETIRAVFYSSKIPILPVVGMMGSFARTVREWMRPGREMYYEPTSLEQAERDDLAGYAQLHERLRGLPVLPERQERIRVSFLDFLAMDYKDRSDFYSGRAAELWRSTFAPLEVDQQKVQAFTDTQLIIAGDITPKETDAATAFFAAEVERNDRLHGEIDSLVIEATTLAQAHQIAVDQGLSVDITQPQLERAMDLAYQAIELVDQTTDLGNPYWRGSWMLTPTGDERKKAAFENLALLTLQLGRLPTAWEARQITMEFIDPGAEFAYEVMADATNPVSWVTGKLIGSVLKPIFKGAFGLVGRGAAAAVQQFDILKPTAAFFTEMAARTAVAKNSDIVRRMIYVIQRARGAGNVDEAIKGLSFAVDAMSGQVDEATRRLYGLDEPMLRAFASVVGDLKLTTDDILRISSRAMSEVTAKRAAAIRSSLRSTSRILASISDDMLLPAERKIINAFFDGTADAAGERAARDIAERIVQQQAVDFARSEFAFREGFTRAIESQLADRTARAAEEALRSASWLTKRGKKTVELVMTARNWFMKWWVPAVLTLRPGYTVINFLDNMGRLVASGINPTTSIYRLHDELTGMIPADVAGQIGRGGRFIPHTPDIVARVMSGEALEHGLFVGAFMDGLRSGKGRFSLVKAFNSLNSVIEYSSRLRVYAHFKLGGVQQSMSRLIAHVAEQYASNTQEFRDRITQALVLSRGDPAIFAANLGGKSGVVSNLFPPALYDELTDLMGTEAASSFLYGMYDDLHRLIRTGNLTEDEVRQVFSRLIDEWRTSVSKHADEVADAARSVSQATPDEMPPAGVLDNLEQDLDSWRLEENAKRLAAEQAKQTRAEAEAALQVRLAEYDDIATAIDDVVVSRGRVQKIMETHPDMTEARALERAADDVVAGWSFDEGGYSRRINQAELSRLEAAGRTIKATDVRYVGDGTTDLWLHLTDAEMVVTVRNRPLSVADRRLVARYQAGAQLSEDELASLWHIVDSRLSPSLREKLATGTPRAAGPVGHITISETDAIAVRYVSREQADLDRLHRLVRILRGQDEATGYATGTSFVDRMSRQQANTEARAIEQSLMAQFPERYTSVQNLRRKARSVWEDIQNQLATRGDVRTGMFLDDNISLPLPAEVPASLSSGTQLEAWNDILAYVSQKEKYVGRGGKTAADVLLDSRTEDDLYNEIMDGMRQTIARDLGELDADATYAHIKPLVEKSGRRLAYTRARVADMLSLAVYSQAPADVGGHLMNLVNSYDRLVYGTPYFEFRLNIVPGPKGRGNPQLWAQFAAIQANHYDGFSGLLENGLSRLMAHIETEYGTDLTVRQLARKLTTEELAGLPWEAITEIAMPSYQDFFKGSKWIIDWAGDDPLGVLITRITHPSLGRDLNTSEIAQFKEAIGIHIRAEFTAPQDRIGDLFADRRYAAYKTWEAKQVATASPLAGVVADDAVNEIFRNLAFGMPLGGDLTLSQLDLAAHVTTAGDDILKSYPIFRQNIDNAIWVASKTNPELAARLRDLVDEFHNAFLQTLHAEGLMDEIPRILPTMRNTPTPPGVMTAMRQRNHLAEFGSAIETAYRRVETHIIDSIGSGAAWTKPLSAAEQTALEAARDAISPMLGDMHNAIDLGGEFLGLTFDEGAVASMNRIMIDYSDASRFDDFMRSYIYPFWMFPSRSIPFWMDTVAQKPWIAYFYGKYLQTSQRMIYQRGAITSSGLPKPSYIGKVPIPGTDIWFDPTSVFSVRYLFPRVWSIQDEDNILTPTQKVISWLYDYSTMFGFFPAPWITIGLYGAGGLDPNVTPSWSIAPQTPLIPPWWHRFLWQKSNMSTFGGAVKTQFYPEVPWQDHLIEIEVLKLMQQKMQDASVDDLTRMQYALLAERTINIHTRSEDQEALDLWRMAEENILKQQWVQRATGYMTGFYLRAYTDSDADLDILKQESNRLRDAMNNELLAHVFDLYEEPEVRWEKYIQYQYYSPEGILGSLYRSLGYAEVPVSDLRITDLEVDQVLREFPEMTRAEALENIRRERTGTAAYGDERREYVAQRIDEEIRRRQYFDAMDALRTRLHEAINSQPIGSSISNNKYIQAAYQEYYNDVNALDEVYAPDLRGWFIGYKPKRMVYDQFRDVVFRHIMSLEPGWDPAEYPDYGMFKTDRLATWVDSIREWGPDFVRQLSPSLISQVVFMDKTLNMPNDFIPRIIKELNAEGYEGWQLANDDIWDAANRVWTEQYFDAYWDAIGGLTGDERSLAEMEFYRSWDINGQPSADQIRQWIHERYPGRFEDSAISELLTSDRIMDAGERVSAKWGDKGPMREAIYDLIARVPPGEAYGDFLNALDRAGIDRDYATWIVSGGDPAAWKDARGMEIFAGQLAAVVDALGFPEPTEEILRERIEARRQNESFRNEAMQRFGSDIFELVSEYYSGDQDDKLRFRAERSSDYKRIRKYYDFRTQYAKKHNLWGKYYNPRFEEDVTSGYVPAAPRRAAQPSLPAAGLRGGRTTGRTAVPLWLTEYIGDALSDELESYATQGRPVSASGMQFIGNMKNGEARRVIDELLHQGRRA